MAEHQGSIPKSFIEDLLARSDIVQVVNQRVPLKKAGTSYKACCPFHGEKTPSFNVSSQKQFYHCFGCGASGDALKFLMEYDGLSFVEAVETLAAQNGMEVPREKLSPQAAKQQQEKKQLQRDLYDVMHLTAKFYRQQLKLHESSSVAKTYLKQRGLTAEIAKEFVIGFAPPGWDSLVSGLNADQAFKQELILGGMLVKKEDGRTYDRFRDRIMFPIRDGRGRVIAFGGRVMGDEQPKYLNSPETPIFHKSHALYGLYEMRQSRQAFSRILVVEGYMDVVALAQFGIRNAVATLGTATTVDHLNLLFREVNEVVFCFEGDSAGLKAAWKALELALPLYSGERLIKFLFLEQGEDPDSTVRKEGVEAFQKRVENAMLLSGFLFEKLQGELSAPLQTSEGRHQFISKVQPYILSAPASFQDVLTEDLSSRVGLPVWRLGQIMGIRVSSTRKFEDRLAVDKPILKVPHLILRLIAVLFKQPAWGEVIDAEFLNDLGLSEVSEFRFFAMLIVYLRENGFTHEALHQYFMNDKRQHLLSQIEALPLKDESDFLWAEFSEVTMQLAKELTETQQIKQVVGDETAMMEWFAQQVAEKKGG